MSVTKKPSFSDYVYSKAAARRLTGLDVVSVEERPTNVLLTFKDGSQNIASKQLFKEHFAEWRRQQGKQITDVKPLNSYVHRVNGKYLVSAFPDRVSCTCNDYATQQGLGIKRGCCKHGYSVLKTLGCTSLAEFVEKQKVSPSPTKVKKETPALFPIKEKPANDYSIVYKLVFQTYASQEQDGYEVPMDVIERYTGRKPTPKEVNHLRKDAHKMGYKLVSIDEQKAYHTSEF